MIIQNNPNLPKILTNTFFNKKFAYKYVTENKIIRIGNIISFVSPVDLTISDKSYKGDSLINFCMEIPDISTYAGVCFQRLMLTNVANLLGSKYLNTEIEILNSDVIVKKEHQQQGIHQLDGIVSLSDIKNINETVLLYIGMYNVAGESAIARAFSLNFDNEKTIKFMDDVNSNFYYLAHSLFITTSRV